MGKVQDTINRITRRSRPNATPPNALMVPTQKTPTEKSFPTTSDKVAEWLTAQSTENRQTRLIAIARALQHSNRLSNNAPERLKITILLETHVNAITGNLKQQFIDCELPFGRDSTAAFDTTAMLLQELAYAYKIALVDVLLRRSSLHRVDRVNAIYSAMRYLGECGLCYSQGYRPWPVTYWRDINTLYWLAEKEGANNLSIDNTTDNGTSSTTIRELYIKISIFYLSRSDHLGAAQMDTLFKELNVISKVAAMQKELPTTDSTMLYSVAINSACAPALHRYCNYSEEDQIRYLNLLPAAQTISEHQITGTNGSQLTRQQCHKILQIWERKRRRSSQRTICDSLVSVQTGLKDCHAFLLQNQQNSAKTSLTWRMINRSDSGLRLLGSTAKNQRIRIGEMVVCELTENNSISKRAGIIRWTRIIQPDDIQIGIELLGDSVSAVICEKHGPANKTWEPKLEALRFVITVSGVQNTAVALPGNRFRLGETINIYDSYQGTSAMPFKLTESINLDACFECFRLTEIPAHNNADLEVLT